MPTLTETVKVYGDNKLIVQSFSDSPIFKDGTTIACFRILSTDYANGDTIAIVLNGCQTVLYAMVKQLDGTKIDLTEAAITTPPIGRSLTTAVIATAVDLYVLIVYSVQKE